MLDVTQVHKTFCSRNHLDDPCCPTCPFPNGARDPIVDVKEMGGTDKLELKFSVRVQECVRALLFF